ncbi:GPI-anchored wall transfer protein 1 like protein [Spraguea lophii 42_110]|uniref:GPI-anchored wall transfer protein 1 n=1 Tax=Spraguea lophii (strain 42_110) TaxID=1358809 RepID=S7W8E9_SPRLO|nr:GPI-anchored wall transfer protein 1 like protein [Spraguea lophii 42_110]
MNKYIELLTVTGVISVLMVLSNMLNMNSNIITDFIVWIIPQYFIIVYPQYAYLILGISCFLILLFFKRNKTEVVDVKRNLGDIMRSSMIMMVIISIFACDFKMFPKRFYKTKEYGVSLMDVGIGSFLINAGFFNVKRSDKKILKSSLFLAMLGFIRLGVVTYFDYTVDVTEYGKHLNFYFILAILDILYILIRPLNYFAVGVIVLFTHEYIILGKDGVIPFIFSDIRHTFLCANKEGIASILPSLSIVFFSSALGEIVLLKNISDRKKFKYLLLTTIFFICGLVYTLRYSEISRRLGNAAYVFWMLSLHFTHAVIGCIIFKFFNLRTLNTQLLINKNMMLTFLVSNLIILIFNLMFDSMKTSELYANIINIGYLFITIVIIKLKTILFG